MLRIIKHCWALLRIKVAHHARNVVKWELFDWFSNTVSHVGHTWNLSVALSWRVLHKLGEYLGAKKQQKCLLAKQRRSLLFLLMQNSQKIQKNSKPLRDQNKENKISWLAFILESLRITLSGQVNPLLRPAFFMAIGADIESSQVQS